ncbi:unnamed protein product [Anisakis simplex]|uniref:Multiple coagulation factor deficiency protein 2 (inferred by orthology to a human protein) n=1 Tax=Anisakis simplex TaxID=6269 RepID=A0A0M3J0G1_ANISI|nr:unnamed protein product [Anisakis simplex]
MLILKYLLLSVLLNSVPVVLSQDEGQLPEHPQEQANEQQIHQEQAEQQPQEQTIQQPEVFQEEPVLIRGMSLAHAFLRRVVLIGKKLPILGNLEVSWGNGGVGKIVFSAVVRHLRQHLEGIIDIEAEWDADQETFQYFRISDVNEDQYIDGLEVIKAAIHDHHPPEGLATKPVFTDEALEKLVDGVLAALDTNGDGLIDFAEFSFKKYQEHLSNARANA